MSTLRDSLLGGKKEEGLVGDVKEYCPSLTWKMRLYGFGIFLGLGTVCGVLAGIFISFVAAGGLTPFAVLYSASNIFGLVSTFFLVGPRSQLKKMFKPIRLWAAIVFLVMIGMTLFAALYLKNSGLTMLFAFLQYCALFWYTLSYIPGELLLLLFPLSFIRPASRSARLLSGLLQEDDRPGRGQRVTQPENKHEMEHHVS
jgi:hypothetical protein